MDRTGTGTRSVFGRQMRFDLSKAFPLITSKKVPFKSVIGELLWFLEGSSDNKRLAELTYGEGNSNKRTIWTPNANEAGLPGSPNTWLENPNRKGDDDLGRIYGVQWRKWKSYKTIHDPVNSTGIIQITEIDQIRKIINSLKNNPKDRRMILTAFNVGELDQMALPPCHVFAQFHVSESRNTLNCQVYIRSNDMFLGSPFNIASYAALVHMMAHVADKNPGELILTIGDAHIYLDHLDQVKEQLDRTPLASPQLKFSRDVKDIDDFKMEDFNLIGYEHLAPIRARMAV